MALLAAAAPSAMAVNTFGATGSLAAGRYYTPSGLLSNGKVIVAGGVTLSPSTPPSLLNSAELYDPATGTWSTTGSMTTARFWPGYAVLPDGKFLVAGGATTFGGVTSTPMASAEIYDPATGAWSATGSMSIPRANFGMVALANGKVLAGGGTTTGSTPSATTEIYDPATGSWSATGSLTGAAGYTLFALLSSGKVLATNVGSNTSANIYDPAAGTWSAAGSYSANRNFNSFFVALPNGKAILGGGFSSGGSSAVTSVDLYDPATNSWSATGPMNTARGAAGAGLLSNGKVLVAGGDVGGGGGGAGNTVLSSAEIYDPATGAFTATGPMTAPRAAMPVVSLPNGTALVPSGATNVGNSFGVTATADIFSPTLPAGAISPESADFGSRQINTGASAAKTFTLSSSGEAALVIGSAGPSVSGTDSTQFAVSGGTCKAGASIEVGSSCTVEVTFNPTAAGAKSASLTIPTNVGDKTAALTGTGVAAPAASVSVRTARITVTQIRTRVRVSGAGRINQVGTRRTAKASAAKTVAVCSSATVRATRAGTYSLTCKLDKATRSARRKGPVRVRLVTTFRPTSGSATAATSTVVLRSLKPRYTG